MCDCGAVCVRRHCLQEPDSKDNKLFLDCLYHDYFYKDIERRVYAHGVQVRGCLIVFLLSSAHCKVRYSF